jgi:hypothetical protein
MTTPSDEAVEAAMSSLVYFGYNDETKAKIIARQSSCEEYVGAALRAAYTIDLARVRREALEDAAKSCDALIAESLRDSWNTIEEQIVRQSYAECAHAIRALANTKQE